MEKSGQSEHILVCVSPSPSNPKVVAAAARMAAAFHASLTAIYVKPTNYETLLEADRTRLQNNIRYAEQCGASVTTIVGDDVPGQVAEYAHISGTTKIVVGRSGIRRRHFWSKPPLTEQIILNAPDIDVYIIPDSAADLKQQKEDSRMADPMRPTWKESLYTLLLLMAATALGLAFTRFGFSEANIITIFILCVLIVSVVTVSPVYSVVGSLLSVLLFNWFFIEPKFSFHTYETEYAVTFAVMLVSSLITGTLANRMKLNARQSAREAFRTKVLLDTNQLLQKAERPEAVVETTYRIMSYFVPFYFTWVLVEVLSAVLRGVGDAIRPVAIIGIGICLFRVIWIATVFAHYGTLFSLCLSYAVSWTITSIALVIYYRKGKWMNRRRMVDR